MSDCSCNSPYGVTGRPGCPPIWSVTRHLIFVPLFKDDGTEFSVSQADFTAWANLEPLLNSANDKDRLYPVLDLEDVQNVRAESIFKEYGSGTRIKVRKGQKTFTGIFPEGDSIFLGNLERFGCHPFGVIALDTEGNAIYRKKAGSTDLYPMPYDQRTWEVMQKDATDDDVLSIMLNFQFKNALKDSDIRMIPAAELDWQPDDLYGLLSADAVYSSITTAGFTSTITTEYGDAVTGLILTDFTLNEISPTPADITSNIASVTESADGVYDFVFTTPETSADVLRLSASKDRFTFRDMEDGTNDITIP